MNTDLLGRGRSRLGLCLLFVASFALTVLAVWPTVTLQSLGAVAPAESTPEIVRTALLANAGPSVVPIAVMAEAEPPASSVATLQDLAVDSDPATRLEAQTLLNLISAEAAADFQ